ncbi:MAG TPA: hypothetical protein PLF48_04550 [Chitinophagales bacterium]|nr:hypothetical protein [Chitinophagales bacterium]
MAKKDILDIFYEYNYTNHTFNSYCNYKDKKLLMSKGELSNEMHLINETFYWLPYNEISYADLVNSTPKAVINYSVDQMGLRQMIKVYDSDFQTEKNKANNTLPLTSIVKVSYEKF